MSDSIVDVVILGGGPAGIATAISLVRQGRSVAVLERTRYERFRAGETLGGEVRQLLAALGVWDRIEPLGAAPFVGISSSWGTDEPTTRSSLFHPLGEGLHVARASFDAAMAGAARDLGICMVIGSGRCVIDRKAGVWAVAADDVRVVAKYLVDASGRGAPATRTAIPDRRWLAHDRLVGITGRFANVTNVPHEFILEALPAGWAYAAVQPDGTVLATLMTDRDLTGATDRNSLVEFWRDTLAAAPRLSRLLTGDWDARIQLFSAESGLLVPARGATWRAVGDAAMACDPLAGNGVARALSAGIRAGREIDLELRDGLVSEEDMLSRFAAYVTRRDQYYLREPRWPDSLFWLRRHPLDWEHAPVMIGPTDWIVMRAEPDSATLSAAESLANPSAIERLVERLREGIVAHEALSLARTECPYHPDGRLLCAIQLLLNGLDTPA